MEKTSASPQIWPYGHVPIVFFLLDLYKSFDIDARAEETLMDALIQFGQLLHGILVGLGVIGDAFSFAINWFFQEFMGLAMPDWVGRISVLLVTACTVWKIQKSIPKMILFATILAALFMIFGTYLSSFIPVALVEAGLSQIWYTLFNLTNYTYVWIS